MKRLREFFKVLIYKVRAHYRYKKKLKEIRKRDPYIYK